MSTYTEREMKLMAAACQSFEGEPKLDIDKFAQRSGLTKGSARNAWAALKKKLYAAENTSVTSTPAKGKATPGKSANKRRAPPVVTSANSDDSDDEEVESPTKKIKAVKGKGKGKQKSEDEDEEEDGYVKIKEEVGAEGETEV